MEAFLKSKTLLSRRTQLIYLFSRQFGSRTGRQSSMSNRGTSFQPRPSESDISKEKLVDTSEANWFRDFKDTQKILNKVYEKVALMQKDQANGNKAATGNGSKLILPLMFSKNEQTLMKLAFAEGYFYGREGKKSRSIPKWIFWSAVIASAMFALYSTEIADFKIIRKNVHEIRPEDIDVKFSDVKGCDECVNELKEVVEYLRDPERFTRYGAQLPKGILLVGQPGTGKTLIARAIASEAGVPFFIASGSEFEEVLVGQGARRVRDLFAKAKVKAPCVVFIDEIDSVGAKRTNSTLHPYANQTINQLLNEMDGFEENSGVIVIGATNLPSQLDPALLRPGRFDIQITVPIPDYKGRVDLFEYYLDRIKASPDVNTDILSRSTIGFAGANIKNLVNQAALRAAINRVENVTQDLLMYARDKVLMGPERSNRIPDEEVNKMTSYHECGHALVAFYTKNGSAVHKITIVSRGQSLGHTSLIPEKEYVQQTKEQILASIDTCLGGRVAEELVFGKDRITAGCEDDLQQANKLATVMVKRLGMSEKVGLRVVQTSENETLSDATSELIESEISRILEESQARVRKILTDHMNELNLLSEALLKYETLSAADAKQIIESKDLKVIHKERERERWIKLNNVRVGKPKLDLLQPGGS